MGVGQASEEHFIHGEIIIMLLKCLGRTSNSARCIGGNTGKKCYQIACLLLLEAANSMHGRNVSLLAKDSMPAPLCSIIFLEGTWQVRSRLERGLVVLI